MTEEEESMYISRIITQGGQEPAPAEVVEAVLEELSAGDGDGDGGDAAEEGSGSESAESDEGYGSYLDSLDGTPAGN